MELVSLSKLLVNLDPNVRLVRFALIMHLCSGHVDYISMAHVQTRSPLSLHCFFPPPRRYVFLAPCGSAHRLCSLCVVIRAEDIKVKYFVAFGLEDAWYLYQHAQCRLAIHVYSLKERWA
jgi:hypothetical protein